MDEAGLVTQEFVRSSDGDAVDALVRGQSRPTAAICYSDLESTLLMHALWQHGLSIPGEVSLVGFNDVFATRYMTPPLTTVGFDAAKIGELGAQLLLKDVGAAVKEKEPTVFTVRPHLIVRGSTGPPRTRDRGGDATGGDPTGDATVESDGNAF
jgi:LacI family transcriptional regulator